MQFYLLVVTMVAGGASVNTHTLTYILVLILQLTYWVFQGDYISLSGDLQDIWRCYINAPSSSYLRAKHDIL